jgi:hypothetical protein
VRAGQQMLQPAAAAQNVDSNSTDGQQNRVGILCMRVVRGLESQQLSPLIAVDIT